MKPVPLNPEDIENLEELKEGVCDSLVNLTFQRVSGFGPNGDLVFGRKPSRHFVSGFLLPGFDPTGENDETNDIRLNTVGIDFAIDDEIGKELEVSGSFSVYVRGLPEWEELYSERYNLLPIFQPKTELRRHLKTAVKRRLESWKANHGQGSSHADYQTAKQEAYSAECKLLGLPTPSVDLDEVALQQLDEDSQNTAEDEKNAGALLEDALYAKPNREIPDSLAEPMQPPEVWKRVPIDFGPKKIDATSDLTAQAHKLSEEIESRIKDAVATWLSTEEGRQRAYRNKSIKPSDCQSKERWEGYLEQCRKTAPRIEQLLPNPFDLKLILQSNPDRRSQKTSLVRVAFEHHGRRPASIRQPFIEPGCFQVSLTVSVLNSALRPLSLDRVKPSYRYRHYMSQAGMGVNCGVVQTTSETKTELRSTWAPRYILPRQVPRTASTVRRDYTTLSDPSYPISDLMRLPEEFNAWINGLSTRIDPTNGDLNANEALIEQQNFEEDCEAYRLEARDIARGIDLLARSQAAFNINPNDPAGAPFRAWIMMNATFKDAGGAKFTEWRLFQIAFVLAQVAGFASRLPSYAEDFDAERDEETASLLYFATGGGKSEAFFGALVYLLFLDRLRGKTFGVSALVRYPLRLLTVQQARRLFRLLVRAELIRKSENIDGAPFQLGFWVGNNNTPNSLGDSRLIDIPFDDAPLLEAGSNDERKYLSVRRALNKVPSCPFCGEATELRRRRRESARGNHRVALICVNKNCRWNLEHPGAITEPLPFLLVDEDIYARAPAVILGTIDKLALIGQHDSTISKIFGMFGLARSAINGFERVGAPRDYYQNTPPTGQVALSPLVEGGHELFYDPLPSLVIQDEAHLLEESLGAFAGLFETALEQVFRQNEELFGDRVVRGIADHQGHRSIRMPKIIAATATVSDPARQTEILYQRQCQQFPRPGPDLYESFYSHPKPPINAARKALQEASGNTEEAALWSRVYVSVMTNGGTHTITTVTILAAMHAALTSLLSDLWHAEDAARQARAVDRMIAALSSSDQDGVTTLRANALAQARDNQQFDVLASLVDLHRVVLTYVTNKKGGDVVLDALQDISEETHRYDGLSRDELKLDLISGGVDMEGIERIMREADLDRTEDGQFVPLADSLRNIVATSAISHGVDVDRFNSMVFAGMPSNIAEYIQASSRVGRTHVGFSLLVPTPQSRRDRYVVEVHRPFHRFLERMISPPAIDRWATQAIKRVMPSLFQAWLVGFVEPRLFRNATDKSKAPQMSRMRDIRRYLEPIKNQQIFRSSFNDFALGATGVDGRGRRKIGEPYNQVYYRNLVLDEAREIYDLFVGPEAELAVSKLSDFWRGSTDVNQPMMSLRDVEDAGQIAPAIAPIGRKKTDTYQDQVERALKYLRKQRASGSELDDETGG
ncbi:DEAD/DEAH box helicase family protein [Ruegeria sp. Ofav3-42]|uniref:DEAD/DEAH box helicase family protein n=1 Tax=Ruegeria sp. Ofav3-42 TaxID=2917759 RepID=UPI001EF48863|nr:DEAD/DEAH box helicase family protein [Ruegeria sp. Ofav3-42]MCG7519488.1 hypothetical protein [Ruegeria sp. Ofav3-42]